MRAAAIVLAATLFLAAGCSQPGFYWYHVDRTFDQIKADYCECEEQAKKKAADAVAEKYFDHLHSPTGPSDSSSPPHSADRSAGDLTAWGELYKQNAFNGCMRSRGYLQLKAHRVPAGLRTQNLSMGAIAAR